MMYPLLLQTCIACLCKRNFIKVCEYYLIRKLFLSRPRLFCSHVRTQIRDVFCEMEKRGVYVTLKLARVWDEFSLNIHYHLMDKVQGTGYTRMVTEMCLQSINFILVVVSKYRGSG